jgi:anaerobic selenocysteine-containing dehydrogenase
MQRVRGGGNAARRGLPARAHRRLAPPRGRHAAVQLGHVPGGTAPRCKALQRPDLLAGRTPRTINMSTIGDDLLRDRPRPAFGPKIEALVVYNSNPVAVAPESGKVVQGFARDDLFTVVLEHFQTDTADYADYILPATTQLEHWDVHLAYGHTDVLLNRPAIAPVGQARPNTQIFRDLARAWGLPTLLCRQRRNPVPQAFGDRWTSTQLLDQGLCHAGLPDAPFAEGGFPTPSGRCEFFSERLAAQGLDGLPDHLPNHEPAGSSARYPLAMISPPARNFLNSSFVNVTSLRSIEGEPVLEIHPDDATARGIATAQWCGCSTTGASYRCKAEVSRAPAPAWSTAWASGGASWAWTAPT